MNPANTMQISVPTTEEVEALHASVLEANERKERARVAAANRAAGLPLPQPGDRLFVTAGRGLKRRSRAGCVFNDQTPTEVAVIGELDEPAAGCASVTISGAEMIMNDPALNVRGRNSTDAEVLGLRREVSDRDAEIAKLRADNARILREARMSAPDTGDMGPSRLRAARRAGKDLPDPEGFGGKD